MKIEELASKWADIPTGKENAIDYTGLKDMWKTNSRQIRKILHELSTYDNGDNYVLIRASFNDGFYKTDDPEEIIAYKAETIHKAVNLLATLKKADRVTKIDNNQLTIAQRIEKELLENG